MASFQPIKEPEIKYKQLFINNEFVNSDSGKTDTIINPMTGGSWVKVQSAGKTDVDKAVAAAKAAFHRTSPWRAMDASERGKLIFKLADLIERDTAYLASVEAINAGKLFMQAVGEVGFVLKLLRYYAGWADKIQGRTMPVDGPAFSFTRHEPVGVCGQIIPWNFPLLMMAFKIAPAFATGCTIVQKPSELTSLTALHIAALVKEAGFPPGVLNLVPGHGREAGVAITNHPDVNKVAFTGSTQVGRLIGSVTGDGVKRTTLELGGKSPLVITEGVDIDEAAAIARMACFSNNGQACTAGTRIYVHDSIYDQFVQKVVQLVKTAKLGDVFDPTTSQGPQISEVQMNNILRLIESGVKEGAKLECGGKRWGNKGFYIEPTVFSNVQDNMTISREEIFGPVMSVLKYSDFNDVIDRANDTNYGLASGIITKDMDKAFRYIQAIEAGQVYVNSYHNVSPQSTFGGYKQSGFGRELGEYGLANYTEVKCVSIKLSTKNS